jgi:hypothetical protein
VLGERISQQEIGMIMRSTPGSRISPKAMVWLSSALGLGCRPRLRDEGAELSHGGERLFGAEALVELVVVLLLVLDLYGVLIPALPRDQQRVRISASTVASILPHLQGRDVPVLVLGVGPAVYGGVYARSRDRRPGLVRFAGVG